MILVNHQQLLQQQLNPSLLTLPPAREFNARQWQHSASMLANHQQLLQQAFCRSLLMLPSAPKLVVEPLVEICGHVFHIREVCVVQQLQLSEHILLSNLAQLSQNLEEQTNNTFRCGNRKRLLSWTDQTHR